MAVEIQGKVAGSINHTEDVKLFTASEHHLRDGFPFVITHWIHDIHQEIPWHSHEFIEIAFIVNGTATHVFQAPKQQRYESRVSKGDIFIINPGELHKYEMLQDERIEVVNMLFYPKIVDWTLIRDTEDMELMDFFYVQPFLPPEIRFGNVLKLNREEAGVVRQMVENLVYEYNHKKSNYQLLIKLMITQLIVLISRNYTEQKKSYMGSGISRAHRMDNIHRAIGYLERHYAEDISLEQLSKISIYSERQLTRIFKDVTGETIFRYLHQLRIERAKRLLLTTDAKVSDICTAVGFNDIRFFNKVFKKMTGLNPKHYRLHQAQAGSMDHEFTSTLDMDK